MSLRSILANSLILSFGLGKNEFFAGGRGSVCQIIRGGLSSVVKLLSLEIVLGNQFAFPQINKMLLEGNLFSLLLIC